MTWNQIHNGDVPAHIIDAVKVHTKEQYAIIPTDNDLQTGTSPTCQAFQFKSECPMVTASTKIETIIRKRTLDTDARLPECS